MVNGSWTLARTLNVSCVKNALGGTDVAAVYNGSPVSKITLDDYDVEALGLDGAKAEIESLVGTVIDNALRAFV